MNLIYYYVIINCYSYIVPFIYLNVLLIKLIWLAVKKGIIHK